MSSLSRRPLALLVVASFVLLGSSCKKKTPTMSCQSTPDVCTEYRGYTIEYMKEGGCPRGGVPSDAPCPSKSLVGKCEKHLGTDDDVEQLQVDFYYRPIKPPHTEETLRKLCGDDQTWTSGD